MAAFGTGSQQAAATGAGSAPAFASLFYAVLVGRAHVPRPARRLARAGALRAAGRRLSHPARRELARPPPGAGSRTASRPATRCGPRTTRLRARQRDLELRAHALRGAGARERASCAACATRCRRSPSSWLVAEVVNVELNSLRQRCCSTAAHAQRRVQARRWSMQAGLLGQTTHVGPWSAEVILITDPEHAVPVQVERTGLRTIAVGTGDTGSLACPTCPANADVKDGDLLVTSGLGGVFPEGYPVARVAEVHRDAVQPLAQVRADAAGAASIRDREVMLVWFREEHPAAPKNPVAVSAEAGRRRRSSRRGNAAIRPQIATHAPAAAAPAASTTPPSGARLRPAAATRPAVPATGAGTAALIADSRLRLLLSAARRADPDGAAAAALARRRAARVPGAHRAVLVDHCAARRRRRAAASSPASRSMCSRARCSASTRSRCRSSPTSPCASTRHPLQARLPAGADRVRRADRCTSSCCSPSTAGPVTRSRAAALGAHASPAR